MWHEPCASESGKIPVSPVLDKMVTTGCVWIVYFFFFPISFMSTCDLFFLCDTLFLCTHVTEPWAVLVYMSSKVIVYINKGTKVSNLIIVLYSVDCALLYVYSCIIYLDVYIFEYAAACHKQLHVHQLTSIYISEHHWMSDDACMLCQWNILNLKANLWY